MKEPEKKIVWTIGHSTRSLEELVAMLQSFQIGLVADIRHYPGSRRYPHFNKDILRSTLSGIGINYSHLKELGGRRKAKPDSINTGWRHTAFRGYADYMETAPFIQGAGILESLATQERTAYMCSEAVWWRCHRALVSDYLTFRGWTVMHIMGIGKADEHSYTSPATIVNGQLVYTKDPN